MSQTGAPNRLSPIRQSSGTHMVNVAILGATGYTALELIKILLRNPQVKIAALTTRQDGTPPIHTIHPSLYGRLDAVCEDLAPAQVCQRADFVFCCFPHVASIKLIPPPLPCRSPPLH